jgi:hypothetical protein
MDRHFRANWLVHFVEDHDIPGCLRLEHREVILPAAFGTNNRITMPAIIADQPYTGQWIATSVKDAPHDVAGRPWTAAGAGLRKFWPRTCQGEGNERPSVSPRSSPQCSRRCWPNRHGRGRVSVTVDDGGNGVGLAVGVWVGVWVYVGIGAGVSVLEGEGTLSFVERLLPRHLTPALRALHLVARSTNSMLHLVAAVGTNTITIRSGRFGATHAPRSAAAATTTATTSSQTHILHLLTFGELSVRAFLLNCAYATAKCTRKGGACLCASANRVDKSLRI